MNDLVKLSAGKKGKETDSFILMYLDRSCLMYHPLHLMIVKMEMYALLQAVLRV